MDFSKNSLGKFSQKSYSIIGRFDDAIDLFFFQTRVTQKVFGKYLQLNMNQFQRYPGRF